MGGILCCARRASGFVDSGNHLAGAAPAPVAAPREKNHNVPKVETSCPSPGHTVYWPSSSPQPIHTLAASLSQPPLLKTPMKCDSLPIVPPGTPTSPFLHPSAARMKSGGLQERRGSCASLILDLSPAASPTLPRSPLDMESPSRERATEEYLRSVTNTLSRHRLCSKLKDVAQLHSEFWDIPMNHPSKCDVPGASMKNRYRTILPNDKSRVILPSESTYINANYIKGYKRRQKAYIATQGPMSHTVEDFWAMVWQENCPAIVMITKLVENKKTKCELYLPMHREETVSYGPFEISVLEVTARDGYTERHLQVEKLGEDSHTKRSLTHYWYTAWPDHKAPASPKQLINLAHRVDIRHTASKGPVVVHCSAGIGRTGCFIATTIGMKQLRVDGTVDILGIVCQLRQDRGGMVQTNEQYEFVYRALAFYAQSFLARRASGGDSQDCTSVFTDDVEQSRPVRFCYESDDDNEEDNEENIAEVGDAPEEGPGRACATEPYEAWEGMEVWRDNQDVVDEAQIVLVEEEEEHRPGSRKGPLPAIEIDAAAAEEECGLSEFSDRQERSEKQLLEAAAAALSSLEEDQTRKKDVSLLSAQASGDASLSGNASADEECMVSSLQSDTPHQNNIFLQTSKNNNDSITLDAREIPVVEMQLGENDAVVPDLSAENFVNLKDLSRNAFANTGDNECEMHKNVSSHDMEKGSVTGHTNSSEQVTPVNLRVGANNLFQFPSPPE